MSKHLIHMLPSNLVCSPHISDSSPPSTGDSTFVPKLYFVFIKKRQNKSERRIRFIGLSQESRVKNTNTCNSNKLKPKCFHVSPCHENVTKALYSSRCNVSINYIQSSLPKKSTLSSCLFYLTSIITFFYGTKYELINTNLESGN